MQLGRPRYHRGIVLKRVVLFALTVFFCLAGLCLARLCLAQDKPFKSEVREVLVPVTVTDDKGRFVSNLDAKDFRIYDEGQEQKIDYFSREHSQPVVVGFLLDMSNNMRIHWKTYQDAIIELIQGLLPGDKRYNGYLVTYGNDAELVVNTTDDPENHGAEDPEVQTRRRSGVVRRDLQILHHAQRDQGRALRTAPGHRDRGRWTRYRQQA